MERKHNASQDLAFYQLNVHLPQHGDGLLRRLILSFVHLEWTRWAGLVGQGLALLGTLVGLFTIVTGVGPRTAPDIAYHIMILAVLAWGLIITARAHSYVTG